MRPAILTNKWPGSRSVSVSFSWSRENSAGHALYPPRKTNAPIPAANLASCLKARILRVRDQIFPYINPIYTPRPKNQIANSLFTIYPYNPFESFALYGGACKSLLIRSVLRRRRDPDYKINLCYLLYSS